MQQIIFMTSAGTILINDCDTSAVNGTWCRLWLNEFDGNSQALNTDTVECIGIPGQRVINSVPRAKTITAKIGFAPLYRSQNAIICTGERGMYKLRRELLNLFPLGEVGELNYKNSFGEYRIKARLAEVPRVSCTAGVWAEATLTLVADYPYWTYPLTESPEITLSAGTTGIITPTKKGDIDSPIEIIVECTEAITGSSTVRQMKIAHLDNVGTYLLGINCYTDIGAGTKLKYDVGTNGELACYKMDLGTWVAAPEYWSIQGYERQVYNTTTLKPFGFVISSGAAKVKIIYHNIVTAI